MLPTHLIEELIEQGKRLADLQYAMENFMRPPEHIIMDDVQLRDELKVSARTLSYWREHELITYSKIGGKIYYLFSDVLTMLKNHEVPATTKNLKIAL